MASPIINMIEKVLRDVWDQANHRLNTSATITVGDIEIGAVELKNAADDTRAKIAALTALASSDNGLPVAALLLAGTNAIGKLTANSGVDIGDVDVASASIAALECTTVAEYNAALTNANVEYSQALPTNCRKLAFRCRTSVEVRYAWATGKVAAPSAPYQTLKAGAEYALDGAKIASGTLYFASATGGVVVEMEAWT